mmetsp:Transcript_14387/g.42307  ORF Transcript_14387/g.42307 Transcript_14387/m.42307 type:complete len:234 (+) Transcript_14387:631-1332(+)
MASDALPTALVCAAEWWVARGVRPSADPSSFKRSIAAQFRRCASASHGTLTTSLEARSMGDMKVKNCSKAMHFSWPSLFHRSVSEVRSTPRNGFAKHKAHSGSSARLTDRFVRSSQTCVYCLKCSSFTQTRFRAGGSSSGTRACTKGTDPPALGPSRTLGSPWTATALAAAPSPVWVLAVEDPRERLRSCLGLTRAMRIRMVSSLRHHVPSSVRWKRLVLQSAPRRARAHAPR